MDKFNKSPARYSGAHRTEGGFVHDEEEALHVLRLQKAAQMATETRGDAKPFAGTIPRLAWQDRPMPPRLARVP